MSTHDAVIEWTFSADRSIVFDAWVSPQHMREWFAPHGYTVTACDLDPRSGGAWHVELVDTEGRVYTERGEYRAVDAPNRLAFTLTQSGEGSTGPEILVEVRFADVPDGTRVHFTQAGFPSAGARDGNTQGWRECFEKLEAVLASAKA